MAQHGTRRDSASDSRDKDDVGPAKQDSPIRSYLRVFGYTDRLGWCLNAVAFVCMVAAGSLLPLMDIFFGKFVTAFNDFAIGRLGPEAFQSEVNKYTLFFVYLFVAKFTLSYIWNGLIAFTAIRTTKALRVSLLHQVLRQEIGYFDSSAAGSISGHVTTNGNLVNNGISEKLGITIQAISTFVAAFAVAFAVQWKLTLITLSIVPSIIVVTAVCVAIDAEQEHAIMEVYSEGGLLAAEVFSSIRNVHAFWAFGRMLDRYHAIVQHARRLGLRKSPNYAVLFSVEFFCIFAGYGLAFWQGVRMYARGEIAEAGSVVTVIFAVILAAQALTQIAPQMLAVGKAAAAAHELFQVIDRTSKVDSLSQDGIRPAACRGDIELRNVAFAYPSRPGIPVLKDFTLSIPANKTTALVGASGSGKSTIIGLLERWYEPSEGSITLDGHEIQDLNLQWLRTSVRLVQQEPVLFQGTIFQNVEYGLAATEMANLGMDEKEKLVVEACKAAFAHDFIDKLPEGYNTRIGERGAMLSGGQKQRIAIARSIISNPRVLLLDEATSALDPNAEKMVQKGLNNAAVGRTVVVVAHRLSTIRNADNIVVMSQGEIVEQGTHEQLMARNGQYARLVQAQDLGKRHEDAELVEEGAAGGDEKHGLDKALTLVDSHAAATGVGVAPVSSAFNYNLLKCVAIVTREQRDSWVSLVIIAATCLVGGVTYPAQALLFSRAVDAFTLQDNPPEMTRRGDFWALMFFVVALVNLFVYAILGWYSNLVAQGVISSYRREVFDNMMRQPMSFFDRAENTTGALVSRLSTEPQNLMELMSQNLSLIFTNIINLVSSCILAIAVGWKLGLVLVFAALPPLVFSGYLRIRLEFKLDEDTAERFAKSAGLAAEAVLAIRTVASLALERTIVDRFAASLTNIAKSSIGRLGWTMFWYALSQSMSFLSMGLGFWYGGRLMSTGEYDSTQFFTVFTAIVFSGEAAATFFTFSTSITKARTAFNYILTLRSGVVPEMKDDVIEPDDKEDGSGAAVEVQSLEFSYPERPRLRVLKGIDANIPPGHFVAFVGPSGCGKTTMISLLERFYEPSSGRILLDGAEAATMHRGRFRAGISLVQQEPVLYQGSIRDNIAMGLPSSTTPPSDDQIMEAATLANIHNFVRSLPEGLATACGALGTQLSGGQRQRIAIARALMRKPRLLLLDEATSALDTESEKVVKAALERAAEGRTTVAVAHRLSSIKDADFILVFSRGRIVEKGSHAELLDRRGLYYDMCLAQGLDRAL